MKKKILGLGLVFTFALMAITSVYAADFLPKEKSGNGNVVVSGDQKYRNLYTAGATISINTKILGDLFAAGGSINVSDSIEDDLTIAGGNINLSAPVGGDARIAGGNINISKDIGGDLLVAGGTISISNINIGGDLWTGAGNLNLGGTILGDARIAGGQVLIDGKIKGNVEVWANESLTFGKNSEVLGKITYHGKKEAVIEEGAQVGTITFEKVEKVTEKWDFAKFIGFMFVLKLIALLISALIIARFLKKSTNKVVNHALTFPWKSLGLGILGLIAIPVVAVLLMISLIASPLGILLMAWYVFSLVMASILSVMYLGRLFDKWVLKKETTHSTWKNILWGIAVGAILMLIPVIGTLAIIIVYLIVYGGIMQLVRGRLREEKA